MAFDLVNLHAGLDAVVIHTLPDTDLFRMWRAAITECAGPLARTVEREFVDRVKRSPTRAMTWSLVDQALAIAGVRAVRALDAAALVPGLSNKILFESRKGYSVATADILTVVFSQPDTACYWHSFAESAIKHVYATFERDIHAFRASAADMAYYLNCMVRIKQTTPALQDVDFPTPDDIWTKRFPLPDEQGDSFMTPYMLTNAPLLIEPFVAWGLDLAMPIPLPADSDADSDADADTDADAEPLTETLIEMMFEPYGASEEDIVWVTYAIPHLVVDFDVVCFANQLVSTWRYGDFESYMDCDGPNDAFMRNFVFIRELYDRFTGDKKRFAPLVMDILHIDHKFVGTGTACGSHAAAMLFEFRDMYGVDADVDTPTSEADTLALFTDDAIVEFFSVIFADLVYFLPFLDRDDLVKALEYVDTQKSLVYKKFMSLLITKHL